MYEEYWESDEEGDSIALSEIRRDNFISNLKKGGQMPLVLPVKDEPQFRKLLTKKALKQEDCSTIINENEPSIKTELMDVFTDADLKLETSEAGKPKNASMKSLVKLRKDASGPGVTIKNLLHGSSALMLFQLPSSLAALSDTTQRRPQSDTSMNNQSVGTALNQSTRPAAVDYQGKAKHCLSGLPTGVEIGKLQVLQSGRAVMNIGGHVMDVTEAIPTRCFETAVYIETHPDEGPLSTPSTSADTIRNNRAFGNGVFSSKTNGIESSTVTKNNHFARSGAKTKNSISVLGEIPYSFVCSYDLRSRTKKT